MMEKVIRYECQHCKKLFKINRHFCFKDPHNKSCVTCKYYMGVQLKIDREEDWEYKTYLCDYNEGEYVIYDENSWRCDVPFQNFYKKRGYNCEWWERRTLQKENE